MSENNAIHKQHRQRLKKLFLNEGLDNFAAHNILELLLFYGIPYKDTNPIAHDLINTYGSFSAVFDAKFEDLKKHKNMTENAAVLLKLIPEIARAYSLDSMAENCRFDTERKIEDYLLGKFTGVAVETVLVMLFDNDFRLIDCVKVSEGLVNKTSVNARKIAEIAFSRNASGIIIAHNHPRGKPVFSEDDVIVTKRLKRIFSELDLPLYEHYVVADGKVARMMNIS